MSALTVEQQEIRSTGIGSSEIAAIVGLSPWMRPIDVWERKLGLAPDHSTQHTSRGRYLEAGLLDWYRDELRARRGDHVRVERGRTMRHGSFARVIATPDGLVYDGDTAERVLEIKSPGWRTQDHWGEPGTDQIPLYYVPQVTWEMACAGVSLADAWVLLGEETALYTVAFDANLFSDLVEAAHRFWRDYVETRKPPPADGSESYGEHLKRRFPKARGEMRIATIEDDAVAQEFRTAQALLTAAEEQHALAKQRLIERIGEAEGIEGPGWRALCREQKGRASVDTKALALEAPDLVAKHTREGKPYRVLRPTFSKDHT